MITNMLEPLEKTAQRVPERIAFFDDREKMTFRELTDTAQRIGSHLAACAAGEGPVALLIDARSIRNIPAMFGVLYAGRAYAPLDITMPPERLGALLHLMVPAAVLADEKGEKAAEACGGAGAPLIRYGDAAEARADRALLARIRQQARKEDPLSILYTSGSTGIPKGSVQTHESYLRWTEATIGIYGLTEETVFGNQSPFFYANSILDVFPPVWLGARVYLLPAGVLTFPRRLIQCLREQKVTEFCMTPSSFISVVNSGALEDGCLPELKWGIMSGEFMPWPPLEKWMRASPNASWWHFYGSTEMFSVAVGRVDPGYGQQKRLPVGRLFPSVEVRFLDENECPVPDGEPGEMYVNSPWVSSGYYRDAERTAAAWTKMDGKTYYRSGDLGFIRPDGQLMVLGRRDNQIKHMGYRMELGDVEAALTGIGEVQESCVLYDRAGDRIFCFYVGSLEEKELKRALKEHLARYMLPDVFSRLEEMPHTASMKIDRAKLKRRMEEM